MDSKNASLEESCQETVWKMEKVGWRCPPGKAGAGCVDEERKGVTDMME